MGRSRFDPRQGQIFLLAPASRPALGPNQPPIQWVQGVLSPGVKLGRGVTLTTHPHLVPRLRMSRSYTSSPPHVPPWRVAGQLYFLLCKSTCRERGYEMKCYSYFVIKWLCNSSRLHVTSVANYSRPYSSSSVNHAKMSPHMRAALPYSSWQ
jgi:hypothetical protein